MSEKKERMDVTVFNPTWFDVEKTMIHMEVIFPNIGDEPIPFLASPKDVVEHGRELYRLAALGKFGPVADYVEPSND